ERQRAVMPVQLIASGPGLRRRRGERGNGSGEGQSEEAEAGGDDCRSAALHNVARRPAALLTHLCRLRCKGHSPPPPKRAAKSRATHVALHLKQANDEIPTIPDIGRRPESGRGKV